MSFFRPSSASLFAFLLRQNHRPNRTNPMTAIIGMMTAIAIVAPLLRPPLPPLDCPAGLSADCDAEADEDEDELDGV